MSRKLTAAALALTVAGGVYMSAKPAQASNMGFKLERSFAVVREVPTDPNTKFLNIYMASFSLFNGLGDVGNDAQDNVTGAPQAGVAKGCIGDPPGANGPVVADGAINSMDALCDLWTSRTINGAMVFSRYDRDICQFVGTSGSKSALSLSYGNTFFALERDAGHYITVSSNNPAAPDNRAVMVGSHDPSYTGRAIREPALGPAGRDCNPRLDMINLPYHSMYQKGREVLCGLQGVDWTYTNPPTNTKPSACNRGIFNDTAGFRKAISLLTFDNVNDDSTITPDNQFSFASVSFSTLGGYTFGGVDYDLTPGDSYIVSISVGHGSTTFLSPHF